MVDESKSARLTSLFNELTKAHIELDGLGRDSELYTAPIDTDNGGPCVKTTYQYSGTTTKIIGIKEENATWDSAWDF